jgi:hypothetical protein
VPQLADRDQAERPDERDPEARERANAKCI